jgi:hypothetical protein
MNMGIMKHVPVMAVICLCLGLYSHPAAAAYITGNDLLAECRSDDAKDVYGCMNYVAGVIDYQVMQQSLGTEPSVDFCLPESLSIEKAAVTVMLYLEKYPQEGSFIAAPAVTMALGEAYPCGPVKPRRRHRHSE